MCNKKFNSHLAPLGQNHLEQIKDLYPKQATFAQNIYNALTNGLSPQINLLVMFVLLKHLYEEKKEGILAKYNLLYVPLSIVAKTAKNTWTRFRPKTVEELHTAFLSFMMAETNRNEVQTMCGNYGLAYGQGHCCGVLFGTPSDLAIYQQSELYAKRNYFRSHIEALAMPVEVVPFSQLPKETIDYGNAEMLFYKLYESTLNKMDLPQSAIVTDELTDMWQDILAETKEGALIHA